MGSLLAWLTLLCCCYSCRLAYVTSPLAPGRGHGQRTVTITPQRPVPLLLQPLTNYPCATLSARRSSLPVFSSFSSFFAERAGVNATTSGDNLAYELRLLELESRLLKLEGITGRTASSGGGGASGGKKRGGNVQGATGTGSSAFNHILPDGEQLLLGCTFAGAVLGLFVGRALFNRQMYLGSVGGAVLGVHFFNKEGNFGACIRALGKLVLYACDRLAYAWSELKFNWKAWRVYERSFKKLESLDKEMQVSKKIKAWDQQYQVSTNLNGWWRKFQTSAKGLEESLKEQAVYWQRTQRLRDEQRQAQMIHQEIQRQQERERARQNGGGVSGGAFQSTSVETEAPASLRPESEQGEGARGQGRGEGVPLTAQGPRLGAGGGWSAPRAQASALTPASGPQPASHPSHPGASPPSHFSSTSSRQGLDTPGAVGGPGGRPPPPSSPGLAFEFNRFVKSLGGATSGISRSSNPAASPVPSPSSPASPPSLTVNSIEGLEGQARSMDAGAPPPHVDEREPFNLSSPSLGSGDVEKKGWEGGSEVNM